MSLLIDKILMEAGISGNVFDVGKPKPYAVYNADEKKLVGIFGSQQYAAKYIYGITASTNLVQSLSSSALHKTLIKVNRNKLGFNVAVRLANPNQIQELGNKSYLLKDTEPTREFATNIKAKEENNKIPDKEKSPQSYWNNRNKLSKDKILQTNLE